MNLLISYLPSAQVFSSKNSNFSVLDRLGDAVIRSVVKSILCGGNLRDLTEAMTRRRILLSNAALLVMYFRLLCENQNIETVLTKLVDAELAMPTRRISAEKKDLLLALIGMTRKGWDNIVRRETGKTAYLKKLDQSLKDLEHEVCEEYGTFEAQLNVGGKVRTLPTASLLRCMMAIGSQTLAIRGSEKSIYGKLFERLILGSVLSILGFRKIDRNDFSGTNMVFWLSDPKNKRECDATAIITPGLCVRFDIGFIGRGNPEISLDKLTRYDHFLNIENNAGKKCRATSHTIIIVDTIGEGSRVREMAAEIGGAIIQMNSSFWVKELADTIESIYPKFFKNPLKSISQRDSLQYVERQILDVKFGRFLPEKQAVKKKSATLSCVDLVDEVDGQLKYKDFLPVYSYRAACGKFGNGTVVEPEGWIRVEGVKGRNERLFVLRVQGCSMEPKIADGSYCVFEAPEIAVEREGRVLLVQYRGDADPDTGGAYTVKRYVSKDSQPELGDDVVLMPFNKDFNAMRFTPAQASVLKPIAEFKWVVS